MSEGDITAPADVDPDESPFPVPAIEGLPFPRDGAEARAIRRILDKADVDPDESPFPVPAIEGLPFPRDSAEARAIRRILDEADGDSDRDG